MARNGTGTYNLPAGNPVVTGSTISSTWANNTLNDLATAMTGSIAKDGQTTPTGNLPMGGFAHTGVADATVRTQYGTAGQIQDNTFQYLTSVSGTDVVTATAAVGMTAYAIGQRFTFIAAGTNTGATTLNINSIGAKAITKNGTTSLVASDIASGQAIEVVYDGTQFQLLNPAAGTVSSFSAGSTGLTPSTATTGAVTLAGTLAAANGGTGSTTLAVNNVILGNGTSAVQVVAPGTTGNVLTSNGTTWTSTAPAGGTGRLLNIQYFTTAGTATYTPTTGTNSVIVECVGGGGGGFVATYPGSAGGTSSFGALVSATGGGYNGAGGGSGVSGDLNLTGGSSKGLTGVTGTTYGGGSAPIYGSAVSAFLSIPVGYGVGAAMTSTGNTVVMGGGGGYAKKRITSGFSGASITVGAGGSTSWTTYTAATSGIVIVYEYA